MSDMELSNRQLFWLMVCTQIIMTLLLTTSPAIAAAQQDAWMSALLATGLGVGIAYICGKLSNMYPGKSLIEFNRHLLGKVLGGFVSAAYILIWLLILAVILKQFSLFITGTIMPKTPVPIIIILMLLVVLYPTLHGVGVIARICELTGPIILIGVMGPMFLAINEMDRDRLLPILTDNGLAAILKGALPTSAFLGDCIMLLILFSFVRQRKSSVPHAVWGVMVSGLFTTLSVIVSLLMFGSYVASGYPYPMLMIVRSISIAGIIENLDAVVITIWIMSIFTKLALYLFVAGYGTSRLLGMKDWRKAVWILSAIAMVLALLPTNYEEISVIFPQKIAVAFIFPIFMAGGPALLWIGALMKRRWLRQS